MRLQLIGHATYLFETVDQRILMDPVFFDPFEGGANISYPKRTVHYEHLPPINIVIISHGHFDHFDLRTLALLDRNIHFVIPKGDVVMLKALQRLGFTRIREMPPGVRVRAGKTSIMTTPSMVGFPEIGVIIQDDTATVWNCVDTVIDKGIVTETVGITGPIDCVLANYNPLVQSELRHNAMGISFPFEAYQTLVENVVAMKPRIAVPSACGLRYPVGGWQNHRGFPLTPERFLDDLRAIDPDIRGVLMLPGHILELAHGKVNHVDEKLALVTHDASDTTHGFAAWSCDPAVGISAFCDSNPLSHSADEVRRRAEEYLGSQFLLDILSQPSAALHARLREWRVNWRLDLYAPTANRTDEVKPISSWFLEFSTDPLQWQTDDCRFVNLHTAVAASAIVDVLDGRASLYNLSLTDRYRFCQRVYRADTGGPLTYPAPPLDEPLIGVMDACYTIDARYVENQAQFWAENNPRGGASNDSEQHCR